MPSDKYEEEEKRISEALEILRKIRSKKSSLWRANSVWITNGSGDVYDRGIPPSVRMIKNYAEKVHQNMHPNADSLPQLGDRWVYRFLKRLGNEYVKVKQKAIDPKRHIAEDPAVIQTWFDRLEIAIQNYKITPSNIWNFDESGFQIGQGGDEEVITRYPDALREIPSSSSRELVSTIEGISATGNKIPPMLIFTGKAILESWFKYLKEEDWLITISDKGYSNDTIAYEWLQHFDKHTREQAGNNFRLLFMDNHDAHITTFPPHTTHILQPLDGLPFMQYKRIHRRAINDQAHLGGYFYDKIDFLANIARVRAEALTPRVIRNGFSARGLWPLDPELIVGPLIQKSDLQEGQELQIYDGTEEPDIASSPTNASFSPPTTAYKLQRSINKVDTQLNEISDAIPGIRRSLKKIFDGSLTQAHIKDQQQAQIERLQTLNARKSAKKSKRQVQVGGILTVKDANRAIKKRATAEEKKAERKRLKALREAPLGSLPPPLTASDEAAIDRNIILNLVEQVYPRRSDPNLIRWVEENI
uniref:Pogo transposable element with ZNF domain n=1 Tax=Talaromyces marneffei PM1 TaxID=1077442 RepID=A0A093XPI5_TALMA